MGQLRTSGSAPGPTGSNGATGATGAAGAAGATGAAGPSNLKMAALAANFTNATTGLTAVGLSVPVVAGHRYSFEAVLRIQDTSGLEGAVLDWDASTATATNFWCQSDDGSSGFFSGLTTTLAADISGLGFVDEGLVLRGSFEPATSGTLALRAAQQSHAASQLVVARGSYLILREVTE